MNEPHGSRYDGCQTCVANLRVIPEVPASAMKWASSPSERLAVERAWPDLYATALRDVAQRIDMGLIDWNRWTPQTLLRHAADEAEAVAR